MWSTLCAILLWTYSKSTHMQACLNSAYLPPPFYFCYCSSMSGFPQTIMIWAIHLCVLIFCNDMTFYWSSRVKLNFPISQYGYKQTILFPYTWRRLSHLLLPECAFLSITFPRMFLGKPRQLHSEILFQKCKTKEQKLKT